MRLLRLLPLYSLIGLQGFALGCQALAPRHTYEPGSDHALTLIAAQLQMHLGDDPYRTHPATVASGQTVFESAYWRIVRLQESRLRAQAVPSDADVVLLFAKGRALERMRDFDGAARNYEDVAAWAGVLAQSAATAAVEMRHFAEYSLPLRSLRRDASDSDAPQLEAVEARLAQWRRLVLAYEDSPYESMARVEAESWEMQRVEILERSREPEAAIAASHRLIERNRQSRLLAQHLIRLGDLYANAARREYGQYRARVHTLDVKHYDRLLESAFASYELALDERKPSLRREAATKIEALLAYHDGVRSHVR